MATTISVIDEQAPNGRWYAVEISTLGGYVTIKAENHARAVRMAKVIHSAIINGTDEIGGSNYEDRVLPENR